MEYNIRNIGSEILDRLLSDKSTGQNIRWATDNYAIPGISGYSANHEITPALITGMNANVIQPRVAKTQDEQVKRTRDKAEVFTPSWICNKQNNLVDDAWFEKSGVFNTETDNGWITNPDVITFPEGKTWKDYVDSRRLEITCGEAPYLVSRYDTVTGEPIPVSERIGFLDRKLRVINENVFDEEEWFKWVRRAFESVYGYDYQGDNVLLARENLLYTLIDNMEYKFQHSPSMKQLLEIATVVSWNIWQMDGLTMTAPYSKRKTAKKQPSFYDFLNKTDEDYEPVYCKIFDWRSRHSLEFRSMVQGD